MIFKILFKTPMLFTTEQSLVVLWRHTNTYRGVILPMVFRTLLRTWKLVTSDFRSCQLKLIITGFILSNQMTALSPATLKETETNIGIFQKLVHTRHIPRNCRVYHSNRVMSTNPTLVACTKEKMSCLSRPIGRPAHLMCGNKGTTNINVSDWCVS